MDGKTKSEWFELLRFRSVGADPARLGECVACATWLKRRLAKEGFDATLLSAAGDRPSPDPAMNVPVVYAEKLGAPGAPAVLFYGHYDVQPPDPEEAWHTPPFEPVEKDGRVFCRGANDDKGQMFAFLCGMFDFLAAKMESAPTLRVILDGQEESSSPALAALAPKLRGKIASDVLCVCDTDMAADGRPAIVAGLRGVAHFTIRVKSKAGRDLHSGTYGGAAPNPARILCSLVASLHDAHGRIAVDGFADRAIPPTAEELRLSGSDPRVSFEPSIEVNGIHSGYGGPGAKTIIPAEAIAKVSMRLVPGQDPRECFELVEAHLRSRVPDGVDFSIEDSDPGTPGIRLPVSSPLFRLAADVLGAFDSRGAAFVWEGASIPIISVLKDVSGASPLLVGFGREEDRIHAPDESYSIARFDTARAWAAKILSALSF